MPHTAKKEEKISRPLPYKIVRMANKKIMIVDFGHLSNASFNNSICRKTVFKAFSYKDNRDVDELVFRKTFNRIFNSKQVSLILEVSKKLSSFWNLNLCKECVIRLRGAWADPLNYYYSLIHKPCSKCKKIEKKIIRSLGKTCLIKKALRIGDVHKAYSKIFEPVLVPEIVSAYIEVTKPNWKPEKKYFVGDVEVTIYKMKNRPDNLYFINYPEMKLDNDEFNAIKRIFDELCDLKLDINFHPDEVKKEFKRVINDLLEKHKVRDKEKIYNIILRHTIGYGSIEPLLKDENIQDVYVDSGSSLVHIVHSKFDECLTNIYMTDDEIDKLTTRLRAISGRPMDASSPVLHAELEEFGVRVCGIRPPSTYRGTGFAFRRRKTEPWTLTELMSVGMLDGKTAGFLSYLIDGQNSLLITGPRSSGKTSLLTALLLEIPQNFRIIVIEDTPEIPIDSLRKLGFKIEHMKTEAFAKGFELSTEDALRTSLRLGDSVLVIGEVRGREARALFEAMRVGASGNVVLGTIHGSSAYDTWDRVVNDLGVPPTSFKALNNIITLGTIRFGDSMSRQKKLLDIVEIGKNWKDDPKRQMKTIVEYNRRTHRWRTRFSFSRTVRKISESKCQSLHKAKRSLEVRTRIKKELLNASKKNPELISAKYVVAANNKFIEIASKTDNYSRVYREWVKWLRSVI